MFGSDDFSKTGPDGRLPRPLRGFSHINRYWDKTTNHYAAKILPGQYYVTMHGEMIATVLGSCISACVRDTVFGIGGMNHFMLPMESGGGSSNETWNSEATRYGNFAMEALINDILKAGGRKENLEIKVFGGANVLENATTVGERNIAFVHTFIKTEGFTLAGEDMGDIYPRKVQYYPQTGKVRMMKLREMHNRTIIEREDNYRDSLKNEPIAGDIDLF